MNKKNCQNVNVYNAVLEGSCIYYIRKILQNGDVVCTTFQAKITKKKNSRFSYFILLLFFCNYGLPFIFYLCKWSIFL